MIVFKELNINDADKLAEIDRSEQIDPIYEIQHGVIVEVAVGHECPNWNQDQIREIIERFEYELSNGGKASGHLIKIFLLGLLYSHINLEGRRKTNYK